MVMLYCCERPAWRKWMRRRRIWWCCVRYRGPQSYSMATWPMDVKVFETYIDSVLSPIQKEYATQLMTVFVPLQSD